MEVVLHAIDKGGDHSIRHDLNFQKNKYESVHSIVSPHFLLLPAVVAIDRIVDVRDLTRPWVTRDRTLSRLWQPLAQFPEQTLRRRRRTGSPSVTSARMMEKREPRKRAGANVPSVFPHPCHFFAAPSAHYQTPR